VAHVTGAGRVAAQVTAVRQILVNLVSDAVKFTVSEPGRGSMFTVWLPQPPL
jgi:hypothetical protein